MLIYEGEDGVIVWMFDGKDVLYDVLLFVVGEFKCVILDLYMKEYFVEY